MNINKVVILFYNYGPYHIARIKAFKQKFKGMVYPIQITRKEKIRNWKFENQIDIITLSDKEINEIPYKELKEKTFSILNSINPDVIIIPGYYLKITRDIAKWSKKYNKMNILLSDTTVYNKRRFLLIEKIKGLFIKKYFDRAFVSGVRAQDYLINLGFNPSKIWRGYDVVDNDYFYKKSTEIKRNSAEIRKKLNIPDKFFIFVGRLSPEKNLRNLIKAYKIYKEKSKNKHFKLLIIGNGPLENELKSIVKKENLAEDITFTGFKQIDELVYYYSLAEFLILPSTSEAWGLVINEAMASGLPVLVSYKCGCVPDLIFPGINGYIFNPYNVNEIAKFILKMSFNKEKLNEMGKASQRIISNYTPETWAKALIDCILTSM